MINAGSRLHVTSLTASVAERGEFLSRMWLDKAARIQNAPAAGALIIESGAPIMSSGRFVGVVLTGQMLNNYYKSGRSGSNPMQTPMVTEARQKLYPGVDQGVGALVALLGAPMPCNSESGRLRKYLRAVARRARMDLLVAEGMPETVIPRSPVQIGLRSGN